jgi:hypothetical protein
VWRLRKITIIPASKHWQEENSNPLLIQQRSDQSIYHKKAEIMGFSITRYQCPTMVDFYGKQSSGDCLRSSDHGYKHKMCAQIAAQVLQVSVRNVHRSNRLHSKNSFPASNVTGTTHQKFTSNTEGFLSMDGSVMLVSRPNKANCGMTGTTHHSVTGTTHQCDRNHPPKYGVE